MLVPAYPLTVRQIVSLSLGLPHGEVRTAIDLQIKCLQGGICMYWLGLLESSQRHVGTISRPTAFRLREKYQNPLQKYIMPDESQYKPETCV